MPKLCRPRHILREGRSVSFTSYLYHVNIGNRVPFSTLFRLFSTSYHCLWIYSMYVITSHPCFSTEAWVYINMGTGHAPSESAGVGEAGMFWNRNCYIAGWNQMFNIYNAQKPKYGIWNFQEKHRGCRKMETPIDCESIFCFFKISCAKLKS